jgi:hypothetical protein
MSPTGHIGSSFVEEISYTITATADTDNITISPGANGNNLYVVPANSITIAMSGDLSTGMFSSVPFSDLLTVTTPAYVYYLDDGVGNGTSAIGITTETPLDEADDLFDDFAPLLGWNMATSMSTIGMNLLGSLQSQTDQGLVTASTNHAPPYIAFMATLEVQADEPPTWGLLGLGCLAMFGIKIFGQRRS